MILTYSKPEFKSLILSGEKIHTIRADPHGRWKPGRRIQHWMGNPRNIHAKEKPHEFAKGECRSVQEVQIFRRDFPAVYILAKRGETMGRWMEDTEVLQLAKNDGLTLDEMREWFVPDGKPTFAGKIIHFTDKMY